MGYGQEISDSITAQDDIKLKGATDSTLIGNVSDRLKVNNAPANHAPNLTTMGSLSALNANLSTSVLDGFGTCGVLITGTWVGTIIFQGSIDGSTWVNLVASPVGAGVLIDSTTVNTSVRLNITGLHAVRVLMSAYTSGTANVTLEVTANAGYIKTSTILHGATDGTRIGNVGDRIKVDTVITPSPGSVPSVSPKLRYVDMGVSFNGIARGTSVTTTWTRVYGYTGSGVAIGMVLNLEDKNNWAVRLVADGEEIFSSNGLLMSDLSSDTAYDLDDANSPLSSSEGRLGISMEEHDRFVWTCASDFPLRYSSSFEVWVKRTIATAKKFQAGLLITTRDT